MRTLSPASLVLLQRRRRARARRNRPRHVATGMQTGLWLFMLSAAFATVLSVAITGAGLRMYSYYADQLTDIGSLTEWEEEFQSVRIYDRTGEHLLLISLDPRPFSGDRTYVALEDMSPWIWKSAIAMEDRTYWTNPGISLRGITRAFLSNLTGGEVQGGSSITQQLIKNVAIPVEQRAQRSYARKIKELILAMELTRRHSKEQILEWYLNFNFYGNLAYGIEAASHVYFDKSSADLSLAEASMLALIPQYQALNPYFSPERAKERQGITLNGMVDAGYITQEEADAAFAEELVYASGAAERFDLRLAPHFSIYVLEELQRKFNTVAEPFYIWKHGLSVRSTLDLDLHRFAEETSRDTVRRLANTGKNVSNASVVAIEPESGEILVMMGSLDYEDRTIDGQVNVSLADRQPGSSFKPYVYIAGLENGMTAAEMLLDVRTPFELENGSIYVPENFDRQYHGPVSLRTALARSYNIPSIKIMDKVGVGDAIRTSHRLGITGLNRGSQFYGLSLVLGGGEIALLDHTYAYSVLGNRGVMAGQPVPVADQKAGFRTIDPVSILEVSDADGNVLHSMGEPTKATVLSPQIHYIVTDILSDDQSRALAFGYQSDLTLRDRPVAAKTGTTNNIRDAWALGYTPQLAIGVWIGNTDNTPMEELSGLTGAGPIWNAVMNEYHKDKPVRWYELPPGIVRSLVCTPSGLKPTDACQAQRWEMFVEGTEPTRPDNIWQGFEINRQSGELADASTPPENRETRFFQILPLEAHDWVVESGLPQPPTANLPTVRTNAAGTLAITSPGSALYLRQDFPVTGFVSDANVTDWHLELGPADFSTPASVLANGNGRTLNDALAHVHSWDWPDGLYNLALVVRYRNGIVERVAVPLVLDNTRPEVATAAPEPNAVFVEGEDEQVNIHVTVFDEGSIDRVEFWINDELVKTSAVAPFNERWKIEMRDIPSAQLSNSPVQGVKQVTDEDTGQILGEVQVVLEETVDWLPDFDSDDSRIKRGRMRRFDNGFGAIYTADGFYLERVALQIKVYDRAGNKTETETQYFYVHHSEPDQ